MHDMCQRPISARADVRSDADERPELGQAVAAAGVVRLCWKTRPWSRGDGL